MKKLLFILSFILIAFTSCENELVSAPPSDNIGDTSGNLLGSWNLTSLNYSGTNVVTSDSGVENQDIQGVASDYNYIMVFIETPSSYIITGSYDIELTVTINGESVIENFDDVSGASNGTWTREGSVFITTESGSGEVVSSTLQILNDTTLKFTNVTIEEDNSTPDETSVSTITTEYIFEKI